MKRIKEDDDRKQSIIKFDRCMEAFFEASKLFNDEMFRITQKDEHKLNIVSLAHNFYHVTCLVLDNIDSYYEHIANSMLTIRYEEHEKLLERIDKELLFLKHYISNISDEETIWGNSLSEDDRWAFDNNLHSFDNLIDTQFNDNGILYFKGINHNLSKIEERLMELKNLNHSRSDSNYEEILQKTKDDYDYSEEWETVSKNYICQLTKYNRNITKEILETQRVKEYEKLMDEELGYLCTDYENNKPQFCKSVIKMDLYDDRIIKNFFKRIGIIELICNWIEKIEDEEMDVDDYGIDRVIKEVKFIYPYTETKFKEAWPEIKEYVDGESKKQGVWCCLQHALTFYNNIEKTSFIYFAKWLNEINGEELISDDNSRQINVTYWVKDIDKDWSLIGLKEYLSKKKKGKMSKQKESQFILYRRVFHNLREIIKKHQ